MPVPLEVDEVNRGHEERDAQSQGSPAVLLPGFAQAHGIGPHPQDDLRGHQCREGVLASERDEHREYRGEFPLEWSRRGRGLAGGHEGEDGVGHRHAFRQRQARPDFVAERIPHGERPGEERGHRMDLQLAEQPEQHRGREAAPAEAIEPPREGIATEEVRLELPVDPERGPERTEVFVVRLDLLPPEFGVPGQAQAGRGGVDEVAVIDEVEGRGEGGEVECGQQQAAGRDPPREARLFGHGSHPCVSSAVLYRAGSLRGKCIWVQFTVCRLAARSGVTSPSSLR